LYVSVERAGGKWLGEFHTVRKICKTKTSPEIIENKENVKKTEYVNIKKKKNERYEEINI